MPKNIESNFSKRVKIKTQSESFTLEKKFWFMGICWDLANGSKHFDSHKDSKVDAQVM